MSIFIVFVWACACFLLCKSSGKFWRGLGGVLTFAGGLVCAGLLFHII